MLHYVVIVLFDDGATAETLTQTARGVVTRLRWVVVRMLVAGVLIVRRLLIAALISSAILGTTFFG